MTLFDMHEALWILAAAGVFLAASASAWLLRVARDVMRRRGLAKSLLFVALSAPVAYAYRERLSKSGAMGYGRCVNQNKRKRREIR